MNAIFNQNNLLVLFRLISAHMIVEWICRLDFWKHMKSDKKWLSKTRILQGLIAAILLYVCSGYWGSIWLPLIIFITRTGIDGLGYKKGKGKKEANHQVLFHTFKQLAYLLIILGCWAALVHINISDLTAVLTSVTSNTKLWILGLSYIIVVFPAGVWIGKITEPWRKELAESQFQGLEKAGLWMGRLERILILTFVILDHYDAIGFLIAAKSIFRFGEINTSKNRKEAEYILIGTMLSFVIAILIGILSTWLLKQLQP
ncbi:MAG: DUF3307 domain-containing protein [Candidatus Aminicenantes bacterium]|nr:DUF3307 domain-containing protein [Candidatus Aminicenantes bacterium]